MDVNASSVIDNPRETTSLLDYLLPLAKKRASAPPSHPGTPLPEITRKDFASYISALRTARRRAGLAESDVADTYDVDLTQDDALNASFGSSAMSPARGGAGVTSPRSARGVGRGGASSDGSSAGLLREARVLDAFSEVPSQFFDPAFNLAAPGVLPALLDSGSNMEAVQDMLTADLDTVECQLLMLIRARSRQFFEALTQLQALRDSVVDASLGAHGLRRQVDRLKRESCEQPLLAIARDRNRKRKLAVLELLQSIRESCRAPVHVGGLYARGDLMAALDLVDRARAHMATTPGLARVAALADVRKKLDSFEKMIGNDLVEKYVRAACTVAVVGASGLPDAAAMGLGLGGGPSALTGGTTSGFGMDASATDGISSGLSDVSAFSALTASAADQQLLALEQALQSTVRPAVDGLIRANRLGDALTAFQAALGKEIRELMRNEVAEAVLAAEAALISPQQPAAEALQPLASPGAGGGAESAAAAAAASAERVQALSPSAFLGVVSTVTRSLNELLQRVHALHDLTERVLDTRQTSTSAAASAQEEAEWQVEVHRLRAVSSGVMAVAVDACERHVSRMVSLRREQSAHLKIADVRALWDIAANFSSSCHALLANVGAAAVAPASASAPTSSTLPAASAVVEEVLTHARGMLSYTHTRNTAALNTLLDSEQWKQADVPRQVQRVADAIAASVSATQLGGIIQRAAAASGSSSSGSGSGDAGAGGDGTAAAAPAALHDLRDVSKTLAINGAQYYMVGTGIMLVKMLGDYSSVAEAIPELAADAISCTVELLRHFNTRSTQLVLGAGALDTAHLKRITAKHLALASQTLAAVLALLPALRAVLLMRLPPHQHVLLTELANVTADILAHENRIRAKFVSIVKDLLVKSCSDMSGLPWADPSAILPRPCLPMDELIKGVATLHRILSSVMRPDQLADVFSRILVMVNAQVPGQFSGLLTQLNLAAATATAATSERFSKDLAVSRLGSDLRAFLLELYDLSRATVAALSPGRAGGSSGNGTAGGSSSSSGSGGPGGIDDPAGFASGQEALDTLSRWAATTFGIQDLHSGSSQHSGGSGGSGASATAAAAATTAASTAADKAATADSAGDAGARDAAEAALLASAEAAVRAAGGHLEEEGDADGDADADADGEDEHGGLAAEVLLTTASIGDVHKTQAQTQAEAGGPSAGAEAADAVQEQEHEQQEGAPGTDSPHDATPVELALPPHEEAGGM